jgi:hypothetical protein
MVSLKAIVANNKWKLVTLTDFYSLRLTKRRFKCPSQPLTVKVSPSYMLPKTHLSSSKKLHRQLHLFWVFFKIITGIID